MDGSERILGSDSRRSFVKKGVLAGSLVLGSTGLAVASDDDEEDGDDDSPTATVEFQNQASAGDTVEVESVTLSEDGYVAIHDASLLEGVVIDSVIGVSDYLEAGTHEDVEVRLFDVEGADFEDDELGEDQPLIAMPHRETSGNETYDFVSSGGEEDGPYVRAGRAVVDVAFVTVESTSTISFLNQESDGGSATVESVELSDGGFVAIHDASLFEGAVVESVIGASDFLEAGTHEDVEVELFDVDGADFDRDELGKTQVLVAMPHLDTNGNEEYDFVESDGEKDGAYTRNGQAVVDIGFVVVD